MGLFSSKKKTYVASSVYNLAGDEHERPKYLSSTILGHVLSGDRSSIGDRLISATLNGPGRDQRRYFLWAQDHFRKQLPKASLTGIKEIPTRPVREAIKKEISLKSNQTLRVWNCVIDKGDFIYWAEDWVRWNRPELDEERWTADSDDTDQTIIISIVGEPDVVINYPHALRWAKEVSYRKVLYALYTVRTRQNNGKVTSGPTRMFTYPIGTGNRSLDLLETRHETEGEFFPVMLLRYDEDRVTKDMNEGMWAEQWDAYKKLTGGNLDDLLDSIHENDDITDVEHLMMVQGVSLNTKNQSGLAYLHAFFKSVAVQQVHTYLDYRRWYDERERYLDSVAAENRHENGYSSSSENQVSYRSAPENSLRFEIERTGAYDIELRWNYARELFKTGKVTRLGGYKIERWSSYDGPQFLPDGREVIRGATVRIYHQFAKHRYSVVEIRGLEYSNYIYKSKGIEHTATEAVEDDEESGFIVPLHYPTLKSLSIKHRNQLATFNTYLIFNSYKHVKVKWYQRGFFKVVFTVAAIVLSVVTAGGSLAAAGGILGSNLAVGAALGAASATAAAIAGAVANAIAAVVLTSVLAQAAKGIFGDKWGAVIGTIISFIAMNYASAYAATGSFNVNWAQMMRPENLIKLTDSVTKAYTQWIEADTLEMQEEVAELIETGQEKLKEIEEHAAEILEMTGVEIDPILLTNVDLPLVETSSEFISRTLLTGNEIAEITQAMVSDFSEISLELPIATA